MVGQVLRQRRALTTAIYSKVDSDVLQVLARPRLQPVRVVGCDRGVADALSDYLTMRRALGHRLVRPEKRLNRSTNSSTTWTPPESRR